MPLNPKDDSGVTLVELLVAIVLLGIILVPLGNALYSFLRNTNATSDRLAESHDAQIATAYFAQDVQSIGVRSWGTSPFSFVSSVETTGVTATTGTYQCGPATDPNPVIRMAWDDPTGANNRALVKIVYVVRSVSGEQQLHRLRCDGASTTPTSDAVLAHNVSAVGTPVLTGPQAGVPQSISVTLSLKGPANNGAAFDVILYGQRRQTS